MSPRENFISLVHRQGYETVPINFDLCPDLIELYRHHTGSDLPYEEYFQFPVRWVSFCKLPDREPTDWTVYFPDGVKKGTGFNEWGVAFEPGSAEAKHMHHFRHPLEHIDSLEQLQAYPFPDYARATNDHIIAEVEALHARGLAASAYLDCTVWETSWYMRSMEQLMMDMISEDEMATYLLDVVTESACARARLYAGAGVDIIRYGDDIGMQFSLMMAPELYREWLKPRLTKAIAAAKAINPDVIIAYHSCGYVTPLINDLIEAGVELLNPVQPECMDFKEIHAEFGDRLSFWGTIGTQTTMPFGTPDEVRREVHRNLEIAGDKGGLYCTPTHLLEPEVPWANIVAYVQACKDYAPTAV